MDTCGRNWLSMCSKGTGKRIKQVVGGLLIVNVMLPVKKSVQGIWSLAGSRMELYCHSNAL